MEKPFKAAAVAREKAVQNLIANIDYATADAEYEVAQTAFEDVVGSLGLNQADIDARLRALSLPIYTLDPS